MKPIYIGFVLIALVCAVGIVGADSSGTTAVSGTVESPTLTLTAPSAVTGWSLIRGTCNELTIGSVSVHTNDAGGIPCIVTVTTDNGGLMYYNDKASYLKTPLNIWDGANWRSLGSPIPITVGSVGTSDVSVPIHLQQCVTHTDVGHDYTIQLTFTLSQAL